MLTVAVLVAVAARGAPVWTLLSDETPNRAAVALLVILLCGAGIVAASAVTVGVHRARQARRTDGPPLRAALLRALPITAVALAVLSLLAIAGTDPDWAPGFGEGELWEFSIPRGFWEPLGIIDHRDSPIIAGDGPYPDEPTGTPGRPSAGLPGLITGLGIIAAILAVAVIWRTWPRRSAVYHRQPPDGNDARPEPNADRVHDAVVGTIDAMLADPDPRRAINGAYARLLEGLAACGAGRHEQEAPVEHLRRVLSTQHVRAAPLRQIIALFELARFSTRPLGSVHREQALDALHAVAADLADGVRSSEADRVGVRVAG